MSGVNKQESAGVLALPERDRLYREWILPHLELSAEHKAFVQEHLRIPETRGFYSHPGSLQIELEERAPVDYLRQLSCAIIRSNSMSLAGPREGALIIPVRDPKGRFVAFQLLSNSQIQKIKDNETPGPVRWWQATGAIRPLLPNGETPILAERGADSDCVILAQGLATATSIARRWDKHAISTTEDEFPPKALEEYLQEFHTKNVLLLQPRDTTRKQGLAAWNLAQKLHVSNWNVRMLVPVLGDGDMPDSFDECSALSLECWFEGQPRQIRTMILGKSEAGTMNEKLSRLNEISHITATSKIRAAYDDIIIAGDSTSIAGLAKAAGVSWGAVKDWLNEHGIDNTAVLRHEMELGWQPERELPMLPAAPKDREDNEDEPEELPLFAFAEENQKAEEKAEIPAQDEPADVPAPIDASPDVAPTTDDADAPPADDEPTPPQDDTKDGKETLELVVEAKESVVEDERPLTQSIPPTARDDARLKAYLVAAALILLTIAAVAVVRFGQKEEPLKYDELPITPNQDLILDLPSETLPLRYIPKADPTKTRDTNPDREKLDDDDIDVAPAEPNDE